jgi:hypothetical protein
MVEGSRESRFPFESCDGLVVASQLRSQHFDRDVSAHRRLVGSIDRTHPTDTDPLVDAKLFQQNLPQQRIGRDFVVAGQQATVVGAILGLAPELRTAAKADLTHVGKIP